MAAPSLAIAGAGIGGMTAALALARAGFPVLLLERTRVLQEAGAGIQLSPNATRLLIALGLSDFIAPACVTPRGIAIRAARSGRELAHLSLEGAEARYGAPYWVIHRADLQAGLLAAVQEQPRIALRLGSPVSGYRIDSDGVTVFSERGGVAAENRCAALIAADGLRSVLRGQIAPQATTRFAGKCAYRLTLPSADVPEAMADGSVGLWLGRHTHLVHYPVSAGRAVNLVLVADDAKDAAGWNTSVDTDEVMHHLDRGGWNDTVADFIDQTEGWAKWSLRLSRGLPAAADGPVTLLGDAAHPTLPQMAQGGVLAIEDAVVLAQELAAESGTGAMAAALRRYEQRRHARAARAVRQASLNAWAYHLTGPMALARNLTIRALGGERLLSRFDWLYGWRPDAP